MWKSIQRDLNRTLTMVLIGFLLILLADLLPKVEPGAFSFAPSITYVGGGFIAVAITHILRRIMFPGFDLGSFMRRAFEHPVGAGLVALGVIIFLGQIYPTITTLFFK